MGVAATQRLLWLTIAGVALLGVAAINHLVNGVDAVPFTQGSLLFTGLLTAIGGVAAIRRTTGRDRLAWTLFITPVLTGFVVHGLDPDPYDAFYPGLLVTPFMGLGLVAASALLRAETWHRSTVDRAVVDGLWVAAASFPLWWTLGIDIVISATEAGPLVQLALGASTILSVVAAADALVSIPRIDPVDRATLAALALSGVGIAGASIVQLRAKTNAGFLVADGVELAWQSAALAVLLATAQPVLRGARRPLASLPARTYLIVTAAPVLLVIPFAVHASFHRLAGWWAVALVGVFGLRTFTLLRENDALTRQLHHDSFHDQLTGFGNRRMLDNRLASGGEAAVIYLDLDGFKAVNDTHGHQTGDALLIAVGERLRTAAREDDLVIRLGGDEFAVVLDASIEVAEQIAERLVELLRTPFDIDGTEITIGTSIGIAAGPLTERGDILQRADQAMYRAKRAGGHRIEMATRPEGTDVHEVAQ